MSMDIQGNLTKIPLSENAILHQSGVSFFRIFTAYRKEKKDSHGKNRIGSNKSAGIFGY